MSVKHVCCYRSSDSDSESEPEMPDSQSKAKKTKKSKSKKKKDKKQVKSSSILFDRSNQEKKSAQLTLPSKQLLRQRTFFGHQDTSSASHSSTQSAVRPAGLFPA